MSKTHLVVTIVGSDKRGLVAEVTESVLENNASIEESHMTRLGGEFAIIMLVSLSEAEKEPFNKSLEKFEKEGLTIFKSETSLSRLNKFQGFVPYEISVWGADHAGIVHTVAEYLADEEIQVEDVETRVSKAPLSGAPLFSMNAVVQAPPELSLPELREELEDLGDRLGVDIDIKLKME
ncbi:MAG: hypothetical protein GY755_05340 [Chloroflexi bacterium]|nr:hypothetical protein [Chloroflexota bacterium]